MPNAIVQPVIGIFEEKRRSDGTPMPLHYALTLTYLQPKPLGGLISWQTTAPLYREKFRKFSERE